MVFCRLVADFGSYRAVRACLACHDPAQRTVVASSPEDAIGFEIESPFDPVDAVVRMGQKWIAKDIPGDPTFLGWRKQASAVGYASACALPVSLNAAGAVGGLAFYSSNPDAFDDAEMELLDRWAEHLVASVNVLRRQIAQKESDQSLRESERQYRQLVEHANSIIIRWRRDGRITFLNEFGQKFFGFSAAEIVGRHVLGTIVPATESTSRDLRPLMAEIAADPGAFEQNINENVRRNGQRVWIAWTNKTVLDQEGMVEEILSIGHDITERKAHEQEMERINRLFAVLNQINENILRAQSRRQLFQATCQVVVHFGRLPIAWIGWRDSEMSAMIPEGVCAEGEEPSLVDSPLCRSEAGHPARIAIEESRCGVVELDNLHSAAAWQQMALERGCRTVAAFPILFDGRARGALTVFAREAGFFEEKERALFEEAAMDVSFALEHLDVESKRQRTERALAESETRYRFLFEHNPIPMLIYERGTLQILSVNEAFLRHYGYSPAEALALRLPDLYPDEEKQRIADLAKTLRGHMNVGEWRHRKRDGTFITIVVSSHDLIYEGRTARVAVMTDISERKTAEELLRQAHVHLELRVQVRTAELAVARDAAEAADRVKSAFLATMSHELRTPLNSIIGFTGILIQELAGPLTAEQRKQLGMVQGSARHLLALINDVLDISKIEAGQLSLHCEMFDLQSTIERVVATVRLQAEKKGLVLRSDQQWCPGPIFSDRRRVEQVLLNLLNNAVKFTERGEVVLTIRQSADYGPKSFVFSALEIRTVP